MGLVLWGHRGLPYGVIGSWLTGSEGVRMVRGGQRVFPNGVGGGQRVFPNGVIGSCLMGSGGSEGLEGFTLSVSVEVLCWGLG